MTCALRPVFCQVLLALLAGAAGTQAYAQDYFDPSLLSSMGAAGTQGIDLSQFETKGGQAAGTYLVDIYINGNYYLSRQVVFSRDPKSDALLPTLTPKMLNEMGVKVSSVKTLAPLEGNKALPQPLSAYIDQGFTKLDFAKMRLNVSVPQIDMQPDAANNVDPSLWQEGVPAFLLNYNLSGNTTQNTSQGNTQDGQSLFGNFQPGLNIGAWRLRNMSTYSYNQQRYDQYDTEAQAKSRVSQSQQKWASQQTYLQRDIIPLRSTLTMGETSTGYVAGQVLDGFSFRGVGLVSNDSMQPGYLSSFAPVIAGIAKSNATVTVSQNGSIIYQTNVAAGPFRITDLSGGGTSGDLTVTITEADGSKHGFRQPFTSLPIMQRSGQMKYEVAAGQYYQGHGSYANTRTPGFGMVSVIYGMPHNVTLYGGGIGAQGYQSGALGVGVSLWGLGALSLDATHSHATLENTNKSLSGESYRARFSKSMMTTGTTVDLTAYRYSTRNYMSFSDANTTGYNDASGLPPWLNERRRSTFEMRLSQTLFDQYSIWVSGHRDNYWGSNRTNTTLSAGLGGTSYGVGWGVNYSVDRMRGDGTWPENRQIALNVNVPLSLFSSAPAVSSTYVNYSVSHDNTGRVNNMASTGGSLLDDNSLSWGVSQSQGNQGQGNSGSTSLGYSGSKGQANLGYNYSQGSKGVTYGASGGLLIHPYGITLSQPLGDSVAIVRTPGVSGVKVMGGRDVSTDYWGNAVLPSMSSYRRNNVNVDPATLPDGASLNNQGNNNVYPTSGAVVVTTFPVRTGQQMLMNLTYNSRAVPFGAIAVLKGDKDAPASIVGDDGQVYLSGMPERGTLQVTWGKAADAQCTAPFSIGAPATKKASDDEFTPMKTVNEVCR